MFKIYLLDSGNYPTKIYDDANIYDPVVLEPELEMNGDNGILVGKLTFKLHDPSFSSQLRLLQNTVVVTQMIGGVETVIFRGRPFLRDEDEYNDQDYTFEGILAALNDTVQPPSTDVFISTSQHFQTIINWHNHEVDIPYVEVDPGVHSSRYIDHSKIDSSDSSSYMNTIVNRHDSISDLISDFIREYTRSRASTMDHIKAQYVEPEGGYIYIENEPYTLDSSGRVVLHNYLKYIDIYNPAQAHTNSQRIEFGKNLISIKRSANAEDFATVLIPLGKQLTDIEKSWLYYESAANWKITKITDSPDTAQTIDYANPGAAIDAETGKLKTGLNTNYRILYDVEVNPGDVFFLTTYLQGVSTDYSIAAYAVIPRSGTTDSSTLIKVGPTVKNSKDSNGNVEVKTLSLVDERIEIPTDVEVPSGMKLRLARYATDANNATGFMLKKFNPKYKEENVTIMSAAAQTGEVIKVVQLPYGRDVFPDATSNEMAPEEYEWSKRLYNSELFDIFGPIEKTIEFSNYNRYQVAALKALASRELLKMGENIETEVQAADLSYIDESQEPFSVYDLVPVKSEPNGIDMLLPIVKMTLPLSDPASATYTLQNDIHLSQENKKYISQMVASNGIGQRPTTTVYLGGGSDSGGGGGSGDTTNAVLYTFQSLSESQKAQARTNIGAVAAVDGKGLSTNDYTTAEKNKLAGIQSGAEANVQPDWNQTDTSADDFIKNKPRIPDRTSDLVNDSGFLTDADISGKVSKSGDSMSGDLQMSMNKITSLGTPTNDYDAATKKYVDDMIISGASVLSPLITKSGNTWSLSTSGLSGVTWQELFDSKDSEIMLMASDGTNVEHLWKNSIIFPAASSITSVDMYFSSQRYNGRTAEGRAFKITVPSDGSAGTITEITGADIPQSSGGSGSEPYEIPITATSYSWSTDKQGDEIYANADNCVLVVNGTYLDVLSSEKYTENGSQYVRIVGVEYDVLNSNDYEFYAYEVIAENSDAGSPIVTRRHYDSDFFIRHHIYYYNENTHNITDASGVAATGSDINDMLTFGRSSVYIIGELMENGDMTYYFYKPMTDISVGSNTGFIKFSRTTDTGIEILTIPANSSTATKTTTPLGGAVLYSTAQNLTDAQKSQARSNIGVLGDYGVLLAIYTGGSSYSIRTLYSVGITGSGIKNWITSLNRGCILLARDETDADHFYAYDLDEYTETGPVVFYRIADGYRYTITVPVDSDVATASKTAMSSVSGFVSYEDTQSLTSSQMLKARNNIGMRGNIVPLHYENAIDDGSVGYLKPRNADKSYGNVLTGAGIREQYFYDDRSFVFVYDDASNIYTLKSLVSNVITFHRIDGNTEELITISGMSYTAEKSSVSIGGSGAVLYNSAQNLTDAQKSQARANIGAFPLLVSLSYNSQTNTWSCDKDAAWLLSNGVNSMLYYQGHRYYVTSMFATGGSSATIYYERQEVSSSDGIEEFRFSIQNNAVTIRRYTTPLNLFEIPIVYVTPTNGDPYWDIDGTKIIAGTVYNYYKNCVLVTGDKRIHIVKSFRSEDPQDKYVELIGIEPASDGSDLTIWKLIAEDNSSTHASITTYTLDGGSPGGNVFYYVDGTNIKSAADNVVKTGQQIYSETVALGLSPIIDEHISDPVYADIQYHYYQSDSVGIEFRGLDGKFAIRLGYSSTTFVKIGNGYNTPYRIVFAWNSDTQKYYVQGRSATGNYYTIGYEELEYYAEGLWMDQGVPVSSIFRSSGYIYIVFNDLQTTGNTTTLVEWTIEASRTNGVTVNRIVKKLQLTEYYTVTLNADGTVSTKDTNLSWSTVSARMSYPNCADYLLVTWGTSLFTAKAVEKLTNDDIKFICDVEHDGIQRHMVFTLDGDNILTTTTIETYSLRPVTVWEVQDVSQGLLARNTNISSTLEWHLTGLNLAPFKRIKIYSRAGRKTGSLSADSSITPASIIEMSLDDRAKETVSQNVFIGSSVVQNPNDPNRLGLLTCAVSADKTKFAVVRSTTLYGTAATSNTDAYTYVFKIEGCYD